MTIVLLGTLVMRNMTFLPSTQIVRGNFSLLLLFIHKPVVDFFGLLLKITWMMSVCSVTWLVCRLISLFNMISPTVLHNLMKVIAKKHFYLSYWFQMNQIVCRSVSFCDLSALGLAVRQRSSTCDPYHRRKQEPLSLILFGR